MLPTIAQMLHIAYFLSFCNIFTQIGNIPFDEINQTHLCLYHHEYIELIIKFNYQWKNKPLLSK